MNDIKKAIEELDGLATKWALTANKLNNIAATSKSVHDADILNAGVEVYLTCSTELLNLVKKLEKEAKPKTHEQIMKEFWELVFSDTDAKEQTEKRLKDIAEDW